MKIYTTGGTLFTKDRNGTPQSVEWFEAPTSRCDCGIFCCGENKVIRWQHEGKTREMDLNALYDLVPEAGKREY